MEVVELVVQMELAVQMAQVVLAEQVVLRVLVGHQVLRVAWVPLLLLVVVLIHLLDVG